MIKISDLSRNKELISKLNIPHFVPVKIHSTYKIKERQNTILEGIEFGKVMEKKFYDILLNKNKDTDIYDNLVKYIGDDIIIEKHIKYDNIIGFVDIVTARTMIDIKTFYD